MERWPKMKLDDCVDLLAGFPFKSQQFTDNPDDVPLVKGENVSQGCILWEKSKYWPVSDWDNLEKFHLRPGDVVIAMDRPWIPAGLKWSFIRENDPGSLLVQRCARLRSSNDCLDQNFLRFVIGGPDFEGYVKPITTGVNVPHISGKQILEFEFTLPPLPIQRRIAGILSTYEDLIENSQRRIKILEEMARRLYREWFVYFRFPGHEGCRFVESPLGEIPEGWEIVKVGEIADVFRGRSYRSVDLCDENGLPFLNLKCLDRDGGFRRSGLKSYIGDFKQAHIARKGDIVMAVTDMTQERRIVARAALVPSLSSGIGVISMDLVKVEPRQWLPKLFLYSFLRYSSFADEVKHHANGANVLHLSPDRITEYDLVCPASNLVAKYTSFAEAIFEQIDTLENRLDNLRRTRDLLLPRLLSGQIDVEALPEPVLTES
jgi:type I restriction enzyme S subunit